MRMRLSRCAPFLILCGLLLAACDKKAAPPTHGPAGKVLKVTGEASATRAGGEKRDLAEDAVVYADDTVRTSATGSLRIFLNHNKAQYQIGSGTERRLDASLAWRAKPQGSGAFDPATDFTASAAAGVHTENTGAEGVETVGFKVKTDGHKVEGGPASAQPKAGGGGGHDGGVGASAADAVDPIDTPQEFSEPTASAPPKAQKRVQSQQSFVLERAKICQKKHQGEGSFDISLEVVKGKVTDVVTSGPDDLAETLQCLEDSLKQTTMPNSGSLSLALTLKPL